MLNLHYAGTRLRTQRTELNVQDTEKVLHRSEAMRQRKMLPVSEERKMSNTYSHCDIRDCHLSSSLSISSAIYSSPV